MLNLTKLILEKINYFLWFSGLKNHSKTIKLLDQEVELDGDTGIFVTLNPAGKGYGGRQKLPDNLKQLFRPVVMSKPDNELITETILLCEGFKNAKVIGRKLVQIFDLAKWVLELVDLFFYLYQENLALADNSYSIGILLEVHLLSEVRNHNGGRRRILPTPTPNLCSFSSFPENCYPLSNITIGDCAPWRL